MNRVIIITVGILMVCYVQAASRPGAESGVGIVDFRSIYAQNAAPADRSAVNTAIRPLTGHVSSELVEFSARGETCAWLPWATAS